MNFLFFVRDAIREGLRKTDGVYRERHGRWLAAQQLPDGAFGNRRGRADLYYTAFALRALSALNALTPAVATAAFGYLQKELRQPQHVRTRQPKGAFCDAVMMVSWWDSLRLCEETGAVTLPSPDRDEAREISLTRLAELRRGDGGWAKTDAEGCGSLYHTFLAACACGAMERPLPDGPKAAAFLESLSVAEGGYLENRFSRRPGTNGFAAAIGLAMLLECPVPPHHLEFLRDLRAPGGGFFATPSAPIADLLSTFTGLFTLRLAGRLEAPLLADALRFARSLENHCGGYIGFDLETVRDCEYTFYGLGVESLGR